VVSGKFLRVAGQQFLIKGVSYGTFAPNQDGELFPAIARVANDFDAIDELGANTVRTYTPPPVAVLDEASRRSLRAIIGLPWMQHLAFLDRRADEREIRRSVREHVRRLAPHPAAMVFALGNEIPPSVVRWYGRLRIERFLRDLYEDAKSASPDALLAYVNYPSTDYLETPFFDICAFNVFLHAEEELDAYIARLHHLAGARPLLISEIGSDSLRNGDGGQAALVGLQARTALRGGACGAVVFTWTDDWWRGGQPVTDWAFGLVDADRRPKAAYRVVQGLFRGSVNAAPRSPRVSVVVCAYNAAATIGECLDALQRLTYPDFELIVVNDGSTDGTGAIAANYPSVHVIDTPNNGLSAARNVGLQHATGEIVAYTDADVQVDPEWLTYLVQPFSAPEIVAAGGPAIVPADDPWFAQCVARAPGAPTHVLLDDRIAEHVPGCNCAFRRGALAVIGGFNPVFLRAGDDVDVCWRIQARGWKVGFAPAALVWHRHRTTTRAYWRQQVGYGEGETWLAAEHPEKFAGGRINWRGHIYSPLPIVRSFRTIRINAGPFGSAAFPSVYRTDAHPLAYLPHSGRWQAAWMAALVGAALFAVFHPSWAPPLLGLATVAFFVTVVKCVQFGFHSDVPRVDAPGARGGPPLLIYRLAIAWLHFVQPFARLWGRLRGAIHTPARHARSSRDRPAAAGGLHEASLADALRLCVLHPVEVRFWSQRWIDVGDLLRATANRLRQQRAVRHVEVDGGWWEDRDLTVSKRAWFRLDVRALLEDHGLRGCLHRVAVRPRLTMAAAFPLLAAVVAAAALQYLGASWPTAVAVAASLLLVAVVTSLLGASSVVLKALAEEATGVGMERVSERRRQTDSATMIAALLPTSLSRVTRRLRNDSEDSRELVGDL